MTEVGEIIQNIPKILGILYFDLTYEIIISV